MKLVLAALVAVPLLALGCTRRAADTSEQARSEAPPAAQAQSPSAEASKTVMDSIELGKSLSPDGDVTGETTTFAAGDHVFAEVKIDALSPGTSLRLDWIGPQGQPISTDDLVVPPDARVITLTGKDTAGWAPGNYRVQVAVGGAPAGSKTFSISQGAAAD
jgi:hypothetical protein